MGILLQIVVKILLIALMTTVMMLLFVNEVSKKYRMQLAFSLSNAIQDETSNFFYTRMHTQ